MADDTIVVFTSDHGDLLGAHGGMQQKWCNAFDEATRVPMLVRGPGVAPVAGGISTPTSHVDLIPTLMGLAGIDVERAAAGVAAHHTEARPLPGRDLSGLITGKASVSAVATPIYFMTEDDVTRGLNQNNVLTGTPFEPVEHPSNIESVIATLPTGADGAPELWKLNHYYERLDDWNADHGIAAEPVRGARRRARLRDAQPHDRPRGAPQPRRRRRRRTEPTPVRPRRAARREAPRPITPKPVALHSSQPNRARPRSNPRCCSGLGGGVGSGCGRRHRVDAERLRVWRSCCRVVR